MTDSKRPFKYKGPAHMFGDTDAVDMDRVESTGNITFRAMIAAKARHADSPDPGFNPGVIILTADGVTHRKIIPYAVEDALECIELAEMLMWVMYDMCSIVRASDKGFDAVNKELAEIELGNPYGRIMKSIYHARKNGGEGMGVQLMGPDTVFAGALENLGLVEHREYAWYATNKGMRYGDMMAKRERDADKAKADSEAEESGE